MGDLRQIGGYSNFKKLFTNIFKNILKKYFCKNFVLKWHFRSTLCLRMIPESVPDPRAQQSNFVNLRSGKPTLTKRAFHYLITFNQAAFEKHLKTLGNHLALNPLYARLLGNNPSFSAPASLSSFAFPVFPDLIHQRAERKPANLINELWDIYERSLFPTIPRWSFIFRHTFILGAVSADKGHTGVN